MDMNRNSITLWDKTIYKPASQQHYTGGVEPEGSSLDAVLGSHGKRDTKNTRAAKKNDIHVA